MESANKRVRHAISSQTGLALKKLRAPVVSRKRFCNTFERSLIIAVDLLVEMKFNLKSLSEVLGMTCQWKLEMNQLTWTRMLLTATRNQFQIQNPIWRSLKSMHMRQLRVIVKIFIQSCRERITERSFGDRYTSRGGNLYNLLY